VIGIDRGIHVLATVTDGKRQRFFGGGHLNHVRSRYAKVRVSLHRRKTQTRSRSMAQCLKRLSDRERRFQRDTNHRLSRRIVEFARATGPSHDCAGRARRYPPGSQAPHIHPEL
jgi:transposase